jgi:hypothetical protein
LTAARVRALIAAFVAAGKVTKHVAALADDAHLGRRSSHGCCGPRAQRKGALDSRGQRYCFALNCPDSFLMT